MATLTTPAHPDVGPEDKRNVRRPQSQLDKRQWVGAVLLLQLTLIGLVAVYVLQGAGHPGAKDAPATAPQLPLAGTAATVLSPPEEAQAPPATVPAPPRSPTVRDRLRADFTKGDPWPVSASSRDTAAVSWPMGIVHRLFVHGPADGPGAVSWLARALPDDVRAVGARVRFAKRNSGAVALTAWHTSVLELTGLSVPHTGMRLVVSPGRWRLEVIDADGTSTLAAGRYPSSGTSASFGLVRRGADVWVTDPAGLVTKASDPRAAALAGPWASWELRDGPGTKPAALEEIWAG